MKNFVEQLDENISVYEGKNAELLQFLPDLVQLLQNLLGEPDLSNERRADILKTLGYLTIPRDVVPEEQKGPAGYMDDIWLTVTVLKKTIDCMNRLQPIEENWTGDLPIMDVLDEIQEVSDEELGSQTQQVLEVSNIQLPS